MQEQLSYEQIRCIYLKEISSARKSKSKDRAKHLIWWVRQMDGLMKGEL